MRDYAKWSDHSEETRTLGGDILWWTILILDSASKWWKRSFESAASKTSAV